MAIIYTLIMFFEPGLSSLYLMTSFVSCGKTAWSVEVPIISTDSSTGLRSHVINFEIWRDSGEMGWFQSLASLLKKWRYMSWLLYSFVYTEFPLLSLRAPFIANSHRGPPSLLLIVLADFKVLQIDQHCRWKH